MKRSLLEEWFLAAGVHEILGSQPLNRTKAPKSQISISDNSSQEPRLVKRPLPSLVSSQAAESLAHSLAEGASTLQELKEALGKFDGCALKATATQTVFGDGNPKAKILLVGEAPGADEDRLGRPFVGMSGQLLDKMFGTIGLSRDKNLYITNSVFYRPPGNRQPTPEETALCRPFLNRLIHLINPSYIVLVGGTAVKSLLGTNEGMAKLRGKWHQYGDVKTLVFYHPAYLLRSPAQKREAWMDLLFLKSTLDESVF